MGHYGKHGPEPGHGPRPGPEPHFGADNDGCPSDGGDRIPFADVDWNSAYALYLANTVERLHGRTFKAIFGQEDLFHAQGFCLKTISRSPGLSQRDLAEKLRIERATATVMLQKMERAGLVERLPDPDDQRISRIYLTESGMEADRRTEDACRAFVACTLDGLDEGEQQQLIRLLERVCVNMRGFAERFGAGEHSARGGEQDDSPRGHERNESK